MATALFSHNRISRHCSNYCLPLLPRASAESAVDSTQPAHSHTCPISPYMQLSVCPLILIIHMQSLHPFNTPTHPSFYPHICLHTHSSIYYLLTVGRMCLLSSAPLRTHPSIPPSTTYLLCFNPSTLSKTKKNDRARSFHWKT